MATIHFLRSILLPEGYSAPRQPLHVDVMTWGAAVAALSVCPCDKELQVLDRQPKHEACEHSSPRHLIKKENENI